MELTDSTFEHQTQASSGMTTGSWLILFKAQRCQHCKAIAPHYVQLSEDKEISERGIILGSVDVPTNRGVTIRFGVRGFPTMLFLHRDKLYYYKGKRDYQSIKEFVLEGFEAEVGETIPRPPSAIDQVLKLLEAVYLELRDAATGKSGPEGYAIIILLCVFFTLFFGLLAMFFLLVKKIKAP